MSTIASHSTLNISETVRVEAGFQKPPIGNGLRGIKIKLLRDRWRQLTPKASGERKVRSAILATAWLLVVYWFVRA